MFNLFNKPKPVSVIDPDARIQLQSVLVKYMCGEISTFEFDELKWEITCKSKDQSVSKICHNLWTIHDDLIDHPICVEIEIWDALQRVVLFLSTNLEVREQPKKTKNSFDPNWPFNDEETWLDNKKKIVKFEFPDYDPDIHNVPYRTESLLKHNFRLAIFFVFFLSAVYFAMWFIFPMLENLIN